MMHVYPLAAAVVLALASASAQGQGTAAKTTSTAAGAAGAYQYDAARGKAVYENTCIACHGATGAGIAGSFPPLKGNPVVLDPDPTQQIKAVLLGVHGPITVLGQKYNGFMPPFGDGLSNEDVANLINYERSSWGNAGKPMTPGQVAALRTGG